MNTRLLTLLAALIIASAALPQARPPDGVVRTEGTKARENSKAVEQALLPEERIVTIMAVPMVPDGNTTTEATALSEPIEANLTLAAPPPLQNSSNAKVSVAYPSEEQQLQQTTAKLDLTLLSSSSRPLEIHDFSAAPEVKFGEGHHSFDDSLILRNKENQKEVETKVNNVQEDPKAPSVLVAEEKLVSSEVSTTKNGEKTVEVTSASTIKNVESEPGTPLDELTRLEEEDQGPIILRPTVKSTVEPVLVPVKVSLVCPSCGRMSLYHPGEEPCACQHCGCDLSDQHGGVTSHVDEGMSGVADFYRRTNTGHQKTTAASSNPFKVHQRTNTLQMKGGFQGGHQDEALMQVHMVPMKADFDFRSENLLKLRTDVDNIRSYKEAIGVPKGQLKLIANYKSSVERGTGQLPVAPAIPMAPVMYTMQLPNLPAQQSFVRPPTEQPFGGSGQDQESKWKWFFSFPSWFWGGTKTEEPAVEVAQEASELPKPLPVQQTPVQVAAQAQAQLQAPQVLPQVKPPRAPQQFQIPIQTPPAVQVQQPLQAAPVKQQQPAKLPEIQQQHVRQPVTNQQVQQQSRPEQRPQLQQVPQQTSKTPEQQQQAKRPEQPQQLPQQAPAQKLPDQQTPVQHQAQSPQPQQQRPEQLQQVPQLQQHQTRPEQSQQVPQQQQPVQLQSQPQPSQQQAQQVPQQQRPVQQQQVQQQQPEQKLPEQQQQVQQPQQVPQQQRPVQQQQQQQQQPQIPQQQNPNIRSPSPNLALPAGGSATPLQVLPQSQRLQQQKYYVRREAGDVIVGPPYRADHPELRAALRLLNDPYEQFQD